MFRRGKKSAQTLLNEFTTHQPPVQTTALQTILLFQVSSCCLVHHHPHWFPLSGSTQISTCGTLFTQHHHQTIHSAPHTTSSRHHHFTQASNHRPPTKIHIHFSRLFLLLQQQNFHMWFQRCERCECREETTRRRQVWNFQSNL